MKKLLRNHFRDAICFTYPQDRSKSQLFFSAQIGSDDVIETLQSTDVVKSCVEQLRKECEVKENIPPSWDAFINVMFPLTGKNQRMFSKKVMFYLIHNGRKKTPMHVSLCEVMNRHGLCISKTYH